MKATTKRNTHHTGDLKDNIENIKETISDTAHDIKEKAGSLLTKSLNQVKDTSEDVQNTVTYYTVNKPLKTLGIVMLIGAAAGMAAGYLLKR